MDIIEVLKRVESDPKIGENEREAIDIMLGKIRSGKFSEVLGSAINDIANNDLFNLIEYRTTKLWDFGWFELRSYSFPKDILDEESALKKYMESVDYRDSFMEAINKEKHAYGIHGPYSIEQLSIDDYHEFDIKQLEAEISKIYGNELFNDEPEDAQKAAVAGIISQLRLPVYSKAYLFKPSTECVSNPHKIGAPLGFFSEIVALSKSLNRLSLCAVCYD